MKHIPNSITIVRIICSAVLLFLKPFSLIFFLIYLLGGLSDMLDGFVARKMNLSTKLGSILDSVADAIFILVLLVIFLPLLEWPKWSLVWITIIIAIRVSSIIVGIIKYHALSFLHTYGNKAAGLALFCFPFLYSLLGFTTTAIFLCTLSLLSAIEELLINLTAKSLNNEITSIFVIIKPTNNASHK